MSTETTPNPEVADSSDSNTTVELRPTAINLKPAWILIAAYWVFSFVMLGFGLSMLSRFGTRGLAWLVLTVGYLGWWLFNRRVARRDRALSFVLLVATTLATSKLCHASVNIVGLLMESFPVAFTAWTAWLQSSRERTLRVQQLGFAVVTVVSIGTFSLVRFNGLDGLQRADMQWRWIPSAEEQFLATRTTPAAATTSNHITASVETTPAEWTLREGDWPEFRGPQRTGVVTEIQNVSAWDAPKLLWRQRIGPSWSSVIVVDGFVLTQEQRGSVEVVACYEAATGKEVWAHEETSRFNDPVAGAGPRATPTFHAGRIFATTAQGKLLCLAASTGKLIWSHDLVAETASKVPQWGYSCSPLVAEGLVVVHAGGTNDRGLMAYHEDSGDVAWSRASGAQTYSSAQLVTLLSEQQLVMHDNKALVSLKLADGSLLWEVANPSEFSVPMLQPRAVNDHQLLVSFEPELVLLDIQHADEKWFTTTSWKSNKLKAGFNDVVIHGDEIFGLDDGIMSSLDLKTGKRLWKRSRYGHGQLLDLGRLMLVMAESGDVAIWDLAATPPAELSHFKAIDGKTWNHPVVAHGRLYVRNGEEFACYQFAAD